MPPSVLLGTAAALMVLTVLTVATSRLDLGQWNVVLALAIASTKATLVALFFMHLKYENRFPLVVLVSAAIFAALFVAFVMFDTIQYQPDIRAAETQVQPKGS
jgi:cytochrome c oxidase subunit 4